MLRIKDQRANSVDLDEVAHDEPPHQDLRCLQIQLFSSLVLKELSCTSSQAKGTKSTLFLFLGLRRCCLQELRKFY